MSKIDEKVILESFDEWNDSNLIIKWLQKDHVIQWWALLQKYVTAWTTIVTG